MSTNIGDEVFVKENAYGILWVAPMDKYRGKKTVVKEKIRNYFGEGFVYVLEGCGNWRFTEDNIILASKKKTIRFK